MDTGRLIQNGDGRRAHSIVKIPPSVPPKPKSNGNGNGSTSQTNGNGNIPPPPPLPSTSLENMPQGAIQGAEQGGIVENIQEEGKGVLTDAKDELLNNFLGNGEDDGAEEEEPKTVASMLTKELLNLTSGNDESEDPDNKELKPSNVKSAVKKLLPKVKSEEEEIEPAEATAEAEEKPEEEEKAPSEPDDEGNDDGGDDDDEDNCLSPKAFLLSKIKPLLNQAKPYIQTLITNMFGVFIGAAVAYGTLQMGSDETSPIPAGTSYKPIEKFTVSPISGIKTDTGQAWITVDLEPLIYGIQQLGSDGNDSGFQVDSTSLVLNVTHREDSTISDESLDNVNDTMATNLQSDRSPILRTHIVSFRIKRDINKNPNIVSDPKDLENDDKNRTISNNSTIMLNDTMPTNTSSKTPSTPTTKPRSKIIDPSIIVLHEQIGAEFQFEDFIPLVPEVQDKLTHLILKFIIISPQQLLESLKFAQNLRVIELDQVQLLGHFDGRIQLPALTKFMLHVVNGSVISNLAPIKTFLFFDKDGYWRIEKITALGVDIELIFDGRKYFRIDYEKHQIISQLLLTNLILENLDNNEFQLKDFGASFIELNIDHVPSTVTHLSLYSVTFGYGKSLENLLHKLTSLKSLELNSMVGSSLKLSDLPHLSLKHLAFGRSNLQYTPGVFFNLDSIYLENIIGDSLLFDKFHHLFNGTRVAVSALPLVAPHSFLRRVLQMDAVEWIYMENFDRQPIQSTDKTLSSRDFDEIEWFLINCGVPSNVEVFLLEKNKLNGLWTGHGVTIEEHKYLWFNLFDMEKFWTKGSVDFFNGMKGQRYITYYLGKPHEFDELTTIKQ